LKITAKIVSNDFIVRLQRLRRKCGFSESVYFFCENPLYSPQHPVPKHPW